VRTICGRDENHPSFQHAAITPTDARFADENYSLEIITDANPLPDAILLSADTVKQFYNVLQQEKPELARLFQLQWQRDTDVATEADLLGRSVAEIYELRRQLQRAKENFRVYIARDVGGLL
jgi:hypothetical protein